MQNISKKSIKQYKQTQGTVLVRVDYNTAEENFRRIEASLTTIKYLLDLNSRVILISHKGRPKLKNEKDSLKKEATVLAEHLKLKFIEIDENWKLPEYDINHLFFYTGSVYKLKKEIIEKSLKQGDVLVLENLRFYKEEEELNSNFINSLSGLADVFVNEAFSASHRRTASIIGPPKNLPSYFGIQFLKELEAMDYVVSSSKTPLILVLGGAKLSGKVKTLKSLASKADKVLIGGAMANVFLKQKGFEVGSSLVEKEALLSAADLLRNYKEKLVLPVDVVVAKNEKSIASIKNIENVQTSDKILDIGPQTILEFSKIIKDGKSIIWNGPLGYFENKKFANGTMAIGRLIASRAKGYAYVLIGGGETVTALDRIDMFQYIDFVSTAGGAMLAYLAGEELPGINSILENNDNN